MTYIVNFINLIRQKIGLAPFVFAILLYSTCIGYQFWPTSTVAYIAMCLFAVYAIAQNGGLDLICLAFLLYLPLELLLANPPSLFQCWLRMPLFAIVFICFSPLIKNQHAIQFRHNVMMAFSWMSVFVAISSFFAYFMGINKMTSFEGETLLNTTGGTFGGITWHSMTLAPLSAIASVYLSHTALMTKRKIYWILCVMSIGSLFFASSRSALLAMIAGQIVVFYYHSANKREFFKRVMVVVLLIAISYPLWDSALSGFEAKNASNIRSGGTIFNSRLDKWSHRISEFISSPVWGVGLPSVGIDDTGSYMRGSGIIEPGSSWLAVFSMTGIVGALFILSFFYKAVRNAILSVSPKRQVYLGTLVVFIVHMFAEGYIFSGGSFLCVYAWASMGACYDLKYYEDE